MNTQLGRHVEWIDDSGGWQVGRELLIGGLVFVHFGGVLVLPQHSRLPVFVAAGKLRERPDHDTLAKGA